MTDAMSDVVPTSLQVEDHGAVRVLRLNRAAKRNALDDVTVRGVQTFFTALPDTVRVVVLDAAGEHFCAGLDLGALHERDTTAALAHSRMWHRVFDAVERGRVPVVSALKGAVIGGGLELAAASHIRVAEPSTFYALPEGQRGLFVGGGGSVRLPRLIGLARMTDLMLTGRVLDAAQGHAAGLSQYLVDDGAALPRALELAHRIAEVAPLTTFAVLQALPRIAAADPDQGYLMEALMAAVTSTSAEAQERMQAFVAGRGPKVGR